MTDPKTTEPVSGKRPFAWRPSQSRPASFWLGAVALGVAAASQYLMSKDNLGAALAGYGLAAFLFLWAMRPALPEGPDLSAETEQAAGAVSVGQAFSALVSRFSVPARAAPSGSAVRAPAQSTPRAATKAASPSQKSRGFWANWRHYTVSDLLARRTPKTLEALWASEAEALSAANDSAGPVVEGAVQPVVSDASPDPLGPVSAPPAPQTQTAAAPAEAEPPHKHPAPAHARIMVVSPLSEVITVDVAKRIIHRFNEQGQPLGHVSVEMLPPELTPDDITFSPDGLKLYVFDSQTDTLQVVNLT